MNEETICELFCGAGGMGFGFSQFFDVSYAIDITKPAVKTYKANHSDTQVRQQDVRNLTGCKGDFTGITGVIGGPPCQGASIINTKRCRDDPRNGLMLEFMRMVEEINPQFFVMENVPGVPTTIKNGVISEGKSAGYEISSLFLNAAEFGAAQKRKRWIVVGTKGKTWKQPEKVHPKTVMEAFSGLGELWGQMKSSERTVKRLSLAKPGEWTAMSGKFKNMTRLSWNAPSPAIVNLKKVYMVHPDETRNISLAEAAALQGFPPDYTWVGNQTEIAQMIANAMPAELAQSIAQSFSPSRGTVQTELIKGVC